MRYFQDDKWGGMVVLSLVAMLLAAVSVTAGGAPLQQGQSTAAPTQQGKSTTAAPRTEEGSKAWQDLPRLVSIKAKNAPLSEIAADLGRQFKTKVVLSPIMEKQRVTLDVENLLLEQVLLTLAPQPYIDYVVAEGPVGTRKPLAIYLNAINEREPAVRNSANSDMNAAQFMVIEGDTEAPTDNPYQGKPESEQPLSARYDEVTKRISVHARKREKIYVLQLIAAKTGMTSELGNYDPKDEKALDVVKRLNEVVDVDFQDYTVEDAVRALTTDVRLYIRTDLLNSNTTPIRMVLAVPAKDGANKKQ
jgi:hypothetical protein